VIDRKVLINGSGNWSRGAVERYSENTVIYRGHPRLTWQFLREFYYLWNALTAADRADEFDEALLPVAAPSTWFFVPRNVGHPLAPVQAYFTSENGSSSDYTVADVIISEMQRAEKQILIMVNHFNMRRISRALIRLHRDRNENTDPDDDVEIKVLMDLGEYDAANISRAAELEDAGIEARYKTYSLGFHYTRAQFMHHKAMIVDGERVTTGSYNWSRTAEHRNYENITVHAGPTQQALVAAMKDEFSRLWDSRRDLYGEFARAVLSQPGDADYRRYVPIHFLKDADYFRSIMTLTRDELDAVRQPLEAAGYLPPHLDAAASESLRLFFDKETGEHTNDVPPGTFIDQTPHGAATGIAAAVGSTP
jgi:phosphatidylserine/phosphatidylglycerophosphate/cardiolipin synthase-like enzyme